METFLPPIWQWGLSPNIKTRLSKGDTPWTLTMPDWTTSSLFNCKTMTTINAAHAMDYCPPHEIVDVRTFLVRTGESVCWSCWGLKDWGDNDGIIFHDSLCTCWVQTSDAVWWQMVCKNDNRVFANGNNYHLTTEMWVWEGRHQWNALDLRPWV